jgi:hypothetical protein
MKPWYSAAMPTVLLEHGGTMVALSHHWKLIQTPMKTGTVPALVENLSIISIADVNSIRVVPWCSVLEKINVGDLSGTTRSA